MQMLQRTLTGLVAAAIFSTSSVQATILLDFGTAGTTSGPYLVDATATPALGGPAGLSGSIYWNGIGNSDGATISDVASGLVDSANNVLTGVSLDLGVGSLTAIDWANQPFSRLGFGSGSRSATGVFANDTFRDFMAATNTNSTPTTVGIRVSGLAAGVYDVWVVSRHTYQNNDNMASDDYDIFVGAGNSSTAPNSLATASIQQYNRDNLLANTGSWPVGDGFTWVKLQATLDGSNDLLIFSESTFENQNGIINAVQISLVPEPASLALLGLGGLCLLGGRSRRG